MGDNANANWAWKNTEIGVGYQAKGVIRQRTAEQPKIKNMSVAPAAAPTSSSAAPLSAIQPAEKKNEVKKRHRDDSDNTDDDGKKRKKDKESKKSKKEHKKDHHRDTREKDSFNPLLQCLAERLSNKTRLFTLEN